MKGLAFIIPDAAEQLLTRSGGTWDAWGHAAATLRTCTKSVQTLKRRNPRLAPCAAYNSGMNAQAVEDWLRVRRDLLDKEAAFTSLAIKVAQGQEPEQLLQTERQVLEGMRELCSAAYRRAFPANTGNSATDGSTTP
jgi:hypothetical protein